MGARIGRSWLVAVLLSMVALAATGCVADGAPGTSSADRTFKAFWTVTNDLYSNRGVATYESDLDTAYAELAVLKSKSGAGALQASIEKLEAAEPEYRAFRDHWLSIIDSTGGTESPWYGGVGGWAKSGRPVRVDYWGFMEGFPTLALDESAFGFETVYQGDVYPFEESTRYIGTTGGVSEAVHYLVAYSGTEGGICIGSTAILVIAIFVYMGYIGRKGP